LVKGIEGLLLGLFIEAVVRDQEMRLSLVLKLGGFCVASLQRVTHLSTMGSVKREHLLLITHQDCCIGVL
jgi:hypothetical protein